MFVVATILPVNMGVLAFVGAFLVGTLVAGMTTKDIVAGFPCSGVITPSGRVEPDELPGGSNR